MRASVYAFVAAIGLAVGPAFAQADLPPGAYWKKVQATCSATAAKPASELGRRIAQSAIDEFNRFGGHRIDSNGRLFRFGLTEAEHTQDEGGERPETLGHLGWWRVMNYWRALYGQDFGDKLEVRGYADASNATDAEKVAALIAVDVGALLRAAEAVSDPDLREVLRENAMRGAVIDTPWSAAFISYVVKQAGVPANGFQFSNAHRAYIYDAFATSSAEVAKTADDKIYRACPFTTTRPRPGDIACQQREPTLIDASEVAVRERIRAELSGGVDARTIRRTHCEVVAYVDARAHKAYTIGGNVLQSVAARKLNLKRGLTFSAVQTGRCGVTDEWAMPQPAAPAPSKSHAENCSLNDRKWFVLMQLR